VALLLDPVPVVRLLVATVVLRKVLRPAWVARLLAAATVVLRKVARLLAAATVVLRKVVPPKEWAVRLRVVTAVLPLPVVIRVRRLLLPQVPTAHRPAWASSRECTPVR
jgi:hypothetical protein